ncbi:hypothetical protein Hanom_Chr05g00427031 [Helianthus anomalus]
MRESHGLETDLNRRMDFTGILERISSIISSGNEFLAFCPDRSSGCSSSRVSIFNRLKEGNRCKRFKGFSKSQYSYKSYLFIVAGE